MAASSARFGPDDEECETKACFDAKTWVQRFGKARRENKANGSASSAVLENVENAKSDQCPLDKDELGRNTWSFLHTMAANYPVQPTEQQQGDMKNFMHLFAKFYPCSYCAKDLQKNLKRYEPDTRNQETFSQWMCKMHNIVNVKIGKPKFDCSLVNERWRDGWKDGSCD